MTIAPPDLSILWTCRSKPELQRTRTLLVAIVPIIRWRAWQPKDYLRRTGPSVARRRLKEINANKARDICHVLIIEDESLIAMDIQSVLSDAGATSFAFAATEAEAIEQARACCPLIITSDVRLTSGTGPAAVRVIRDSLGMIPVLFISGTPNDCNPREPGDAVFGKPFDHAAIAAAFSKILSGSRSSNIARPMA